jgi:hypothetical protein
LSFDSPFWFAKEDLLTDLLRAEIHFIRELFANHPDLREFFDLPEATMQQRAACFAALAHRAIMDEIYETFARRYEQSPSLGEEENDAIKLSQNLFPEDAPAWVSETNRVVALLPSRIYEALPEPLRRGGYHADNATETEIISAAANKFSNLQDIQALNGQVLGQQLKRLEQRWSVVAPAANPSREVATQGREFKKRNRNRTQDKQRMLRDREIAEIDDVARDIYEFLKIMDERKVKPQPTWSAWPGSWREAYKIPSLRELIHKDKSRSLTRFKRDRRR